MNIHRALAEVQDLKEHLGEEFRGRVAYNFTDTPEVRFEGFQFPPGWKNTRGSRHGRVLFELPESYPDHPPHVYVDGEMRFEGGRPAAMAPARQDGDSKWVPLSVFPSERNWDPEANSLTTAVTQLMEVLQAPDREIPIESDAGRTNDTDERAEPSEVNDDRTDESSEGSEQ